MVDPKIECAKNYYTKNVVVKEPPSFELHELSSFYIELQRETNLFVEIFC